VNIPHVNVPEPVAWSILFLGVFHVMAAGDLWFIAAAGLCTWLLRAKPWNPYVTKTSEEP